MRSFSIITMAALAVGIVSSQAQASVIITQSAAPAPTYSILLNFDEPGGASGVNVPNNSWSGAPWNIPVFQSGDTVANFVGDNSGGTAQGTNSYYGPFGVFIEFGQDLTELSFQGWDNGGTPSPFGGGAIVAAFNDGVDVAVLPITPAWGGVGDSWFNITTTGGMVFDELRFLGFDFFPQSVVDNLSWNVVPEPGSLALLGLGIVGVLRRRTR